MQQPCLPISGRALLQFFVIVQDSGPVGCRGATQLEQAKPALAGDTSVAMLGRALIFAKGRVHDLRITSRDMASYLWPGTPVVSGNKTDAQAGPSGMWRDSE